MTNAKPVSEKVEQVRADIERRAAYAQEQADDTLAEIEARVLENPLGAVAVAAGLGFLLSRLRADKAAIHLGVVPFLAGAIATYMFNRRD